ncbi:MAG: phosphate acyltransferase PlsX [Acidimicrobiia bacterium]|nr:phosphate acyltransferase PlsX [Acidimicrobiia bacterium]
MARVALDAMGGDRAPDEIIAGGVLAAGAGHDVILVGEPSLIADRLAALGTKLPVVAAAQVIGMDEDPARAIREKPDSSIAVAARLVKAGEADALVSAGSTGATLAAAAVILRRMPGVLRPAVASIFPTPGSHTVVLDSGANPECKPEHLVQFAVMGSLVAELYLGVRNPRVGLLNIGEEESKGRDLEKAAFELLRATSLNFIGNVEGRDLASDRADVFVTDGFTGNILLKTTEGAVQFIAELFQAAVINLPPQDLAVIDPVLAEVRRRVDHEEYGGGHLLGTNGVVVIAHGSSSRIAIANAVAMASTGADRDLAGHVAKRLEP